MIQTHYVPLERPYRIVYTGGVVGLQIGTLIVIESGVTSKAFRPNHFQMVLGSEEYRTKTHPVVSYVNKSFYNTDGNVEKIRTLSEAVVWDKVDQSEIVTLCLEGQKIRWDDFLSLFVINTFRIGDIEKLGTEIQKLYRFYDLLRNVGGDIECPYTDDYISRNKNENGALFLNCKILCGTFFNDEEQKEETYFTSLYQSGPIYVDADTSDVEHAYDILSLQSTFYHEILSKINPAAEYIVKFDPFIVDNQTGKALDIQNKLIELCKRLNQD